MFGVIAAIVMTMPAPAAFAIGLGEIEVSSRLNQPLAASIPVRSVDVADIDTVVVRVASQAAYDRAGLERADYLAGISFEVVAQGDRPVILLRGSAPAREPFLNILLDVRARSGQLLREYTVLLDPPGFEVARSAPTPGPSPLSPAPTPPVSSAPERSPAPATSVAAQPPTTAPTSVPAPTPAPATTPQPTAAPAPAPTSARSADAEPEFFATDAERARALDPELLDSLGILSARGQPARAASPAAAASQRTAVDGRYTVQRGETLWRVAFNTRHGEQVTMDQMQLAIARANPSAFDAGDISRILAGARLRIPELDEVRSVDPASATRELNVLRTGGSSLAEAPRPRPASPLPTAPTPPPEPQTPAAEAEPETAREPQPEATDTITLLDPGLEEPPMDADADAVVSGAPESDVSGATEPVVDPLVDEPAPEVSVRDEQEAAPVPAARPAAPMSPPSTGDGGGFPWRLLLIGLAVLLLLAAGLVAWRRRQADKALAADAVAASPVAEPEPEFETEASKLEPEADMDDADKTQAFAASAATTLALGEEEPDPADPDVAEIEATMASAPAQPRRSVPDSEEFDVTSQFEAQTMQIDLDGGDPVAEADFHLAYGLYDEAALLLREAADKAPERVDVRMKLAETYFAAGKQVEFLEVADEVKDRLGEADRQKLTVMAQQIAPGTALAALSTVSSQVSEIDFTLEANEEPQAEVDAAAEGLVDFDLGEVTEAAAESSDEQSSWKDDGVSIDFDLSEPAPSATKSDDDVERVSDSASDSEADNSLDFDLDMDLSPESAPEAGETETGPRAESQDLPETDLELNAPDGDVDELARELGDFDLGEPAAAGSALELDDFDIGDASESLPAVADGDEVATKLDLARAYIDMGDSDMARALLNEVEVQGSEAQQAEARELIGGLS
jgi:pilus assembly protein FimV